MFCKVYSADICGIDAFKICVEADVAAGLPGFNIVGLPSSEVRESKERVERAIINSDFDFPARRITINLSPAYLRKQGSGLDLPIAIAILANLGEIDIRNLDGCMFAGELSLDGSINSVNGILAIAYLAKESGFGSLVVPFENANEGAAVAGIKIYGCKNLKDLVKALKSKTLKDIEHVDLDTLLENAYEKSNLDYSDVTGQESAKKATMTAVSGFHNIMYIGPPGAGKSMMARRIPTIFGRLTKEECLELSKIYSIAGKLEGNSLKLERPFRAPHQSITSAALLGGSANPKPGEITLAHKGVLFLDELTEFKRNIINELRAPLEDKNILISRSRQNVVFPCDFMLVAATNPCPCGYYPDRRFCRCNENDVSRYLSRIKGPILDRIDICVGISKVDGDSLKNKKAGMSSSDMRRRVLTAQEIQAERFAGENIMFNSQMNKAQADAFCTMSPEAENTLNRAYEKLNMTARGWYKILKVARTIADLGESKNIENNHMLEAIGYRNTFVNK